MVRTLSRWRKVIGLACAFVLTGLVALMLRPFESDLDLSFVPWRCWSR